MSDDEKSCGATPVSLRLFSSPEFVVKFMCGTKFLGCRKRAWERSPLFGHSRDGRDSLTYFRLTTSCHQLFPPAYFFSVSSTQYLRQYSFVEVFCVNGPMFSGGDQKQPCKPFNALLVPGPNPPIAALLGPINLLTGLLTHATGARVQLSAARI
jgi:hypothetical protein